MTKNDDRTNKKIDGPSPRSEIITHAFYQLADMRKHSSRQFSMKSSYARRKRARIFREKLERGERVLINFSLFSKEKKGGGGERKNERTKGFSGWSD